MRIRRRSAVDKPRIELIPMIDTMAFLLVFFMIASLAMTQQMGLSVNVPKVPAANPQTWGDRALVVSIDARGRFFLNKAPVAWGRLEAEVRNRLAARPELIVVINADQNLRHGLVTRVMSVVERAGAGQLVIATARTEGRRTASDGGTP